MKTGAGAKANYTLEVPRLANQRAHLVLFEALVTGPTLGPIEARRQLGFVAAACKVELLLFEACRLRQVSSRNECQVEVGAR